MCDQSIEFWDFLNEEPEKRDEGKCNEAKTTKVESCNLIRSSEISNQSEVHSKIPEQAREEVNGHNNSTKHSEYNSQINNVPDDPKSSYNAYSKSYYKCDEEFWDFLKDSSTVEEFQNSFVQNSSVQNTPLDRTADLLSQYSSAEDSAYQSLSSIVEEISHSRNVSARNRTFSKTESKKTICEVNYSLTADSFKNVDPDDVFGDCRSPAKVKSNSDDEFWDFLKSDSPVVGLKELMRELPSFFNTVSSDNANEDEYSSTLHGESSFLDAFGFADSGNRGVGNDAIYSNLKTLLCNKTGETGIGTNVKKSDIQNKSLQHKKSNHGQKRKLLNESFQKNVSSNNKVGKDGTESVYSVPFHHEKGPLAHRSELFFGNKGNEEERLVYHQKTLEIHAHKSTQQTHFKNVRAIGQQKSSQRNRSSAKHSPFGCSHFNVTDSVSNASTGKTVSENFHTHSSKTSYNQPLVLETNFNKFTQKQAISNPMTLLGSNDSNISNNLYWILPTNQNSQYLFLQNKASESVQLPTGNSSKHNALNINLETRDKIDNQFDDKVNDIPFNSGQLNINVFLNSEVPKQSLPLKNSVQNDVLSPMTMRNNSNNYQSFKKFNASNSVKNITENNFLLKHKDCSSTNSVISSTISKKDIQALKLVQSIKPIQKALHTLKPKTIPSSTKQQLLKPIKSITLGKDKNAIQQTSIPLKMGSISQGKQLCDKQGNVINYFYYSNPSSLLQSNIVTANAFDKVNTTENEQNLNVKSTNITHNSIPIPSVKTEGSISTNMHHTPLLREYNSSVNNTDSSKQNVYAPGQTLCFVNTSTVQPLKPQIVTNSDTLFPTNTPIINSYTIGNLKPNASTSSTGLPSTSYAPIKVVPIQQKSLSNLEQHFVPVSTSIGPVCVLPKWQKVLQPSSATKVLVLKGLAPQNIVQRNLLPIPRVNSEKPTASVKKSVAKPKKMGRKTVRELLEERQHKIMANKPRKERVLRPVQKIDSYSSYYSNIPTRVGVGMYGKVSGSSVQQTDLNKRPNILMLPSACKILKKNIIKDDDTNCFSQNDDESAVDSAGLESFPKGKLNYRPRHYDMAELQIGNFQVNDDMDSYGRFRSKFKVLFSKRQFLYEFPVERCNQADLKTQVCEQMVRIMVPFQILMSMDFSDRTIHISIHSMPSIYLGRLQLRPGVVSNTIVYDTTIESGSSWENMISSFNHKVVLRKRQVNKLKSVLYQFDEKFIALANNKYQNGEHNSNSPEEGELSPTTLKKSLNKSKKNCIRRLRQWDSSEHEEEMVDDDILRPQMCSCRISCRSVRCSCAKSAKSCSSVCSCINCGNPLNVLESIGIDIEFSLKDRCLFQNIYRIPNLLDFLLREIRLGCCHGSARVQDCIPGSVLCPNTGCSARIEFSWCRGIACYPERNPRNHCSFCGQCCFSNGQHCMACNRCYVKVSSEFPDCPNCQDKPKSHDGDLIPYSQFQPAEYHQTASPKVSTKPEIIILNSFSIPKDSAIFDSESPEKPQEDNFEGQTDDACYIEQMDFEVKEN